MRHCAYDTEHAAPVAAEVVKLEARYSYAEDGTELLAAQTVFSCRSCAENLFDGTEEFPGYAELPEDEA